MSQNRTAHLHLKGILKKIQKDLHFNILFEVTTRLGKFNSPNPYLSYRQFAYSIAYR